MDAVSATIFDVLVIGAGPTGLACAIDAQEAGFTAWWWWIRVAFATRCFTIRRT